MSLRTRLVLVLAFFTAAVIALFALFAMAFAFSVEDRFIERQLEQVATPLRAAYAQTGHWPQPTEAGFHVVQRAADLPPELATVLAREPGRREIGHSDGRHYHLLPLQGRHGPPWLLAEVSGQLIVRPMRAELLGWLLGWGLALLALAALLGAWLAQRVLRPLQALSHAAADARPDALPDLPGRERTDEIGELARRLGVLLTRTRDFIAREQAFSRDASHELRTPLAVLRMGLETAPHSETLRAAVRQMQQTLDALLLLSRELPPGRSAPLPLVEDWVLAHAPLLDARGLRLELQLRRDESLPLPEPLLQAVLASLLANALAHAELGACIRLHWRGSALVIANRGTGNAAGAGLGLPLVRRLLALQQAHLDFEQRDGWTEVAICPGHTAGHGR